MSIKNHENPRFLLTPNFNQVRNVITFLIISFFAYQNVYDNFIGEGWFYAYLTSLSMFMFPVFTNLYI